MDSEYLGSEPSAISLEPTRVLDLAFMASPSSISNASSLGSPEISLLSMEPDFGLDFQPDTSAEILSAAGNVPLLLRDLELPGSQPPIPFGQNVPHIWADDPRLVPDIINLSKLTLSENQKSALQLGAKYRQTPHSLPFLKLIAGSESVAREIEQTDLATGVKFRSACVDLIKKAKVPRSNMRGHLRRALADLSNNEDVVVTMADKGGKIVILDAVQYSEMCLVHLQDSAYQRIYSLGTGRTKISFQNDSLFKGNFGEMDSSDLLIRRQCKELTSLLNELKNKRQVSVRERRNLIPCQPYSGKLPNFYGLPKIHKLGALKIRPIISNWGLFCDRLLLVLKSILNLLIWGSTILLNSFELVQLLDDVTFTAQDLLISFDVASLYTRVPINESLEIIEQRLEDMRTLKNDPIAAITTLTNKAIMKLLKFVLGQCYFSWDSTLYLQRAGLPMGSRISPIIANIFLENLEYRVLTSSLSVPKLYLRYVDDIFIIWNQAKGDYKNFLALLNQQHPNISLTEELENNGSLPFLDVVISRPVVSPRVQDCTPLTVAVYRKPSHSDRYLHFRSAHPENLKKNVVRGLWLRANRLLHKYPFQLNRELSHLKSTLTSDTNQYPPDRVNRWFQQFSTDLNRNPDLLRQKVHLNSDEIFDLYGQQIFEVPSAMGRYSSELDTTQLDSDFDLEPLERDLGTIVEEGLQETDEQSEARDRITVVGDENSDDEGDQIEVLQPCQTRQPTLVVPFVPGIGDRLKKLANGFHIRTWFTFPGRSLDRFNHHRGSLHQSKVRHSVYCTRCICGKEYVGESIRNLKVRLAEHSRKSCASAFAMHIHQKDPGHAPNLKDTTILATEKNTTKRKIIETLCIHNKAQKICNCTSSTDLPTIWELCAEGVQKELELD